MSLCSEGSFLTTSQNCDLVCRRGFSPRAQHAVRIWNRIHATRRTKKEKTNVDTHFICNKLLSHFQISAISLILYEFLTASSVIFRFFAFVASVLFRILNSLWHSCANPYAHTRSHFCDVAKKTLLSTKTYEILTSAGPDNHPKRVPKKAFR